MESACCPISFFPPVHSVFTELAATYGKFTVICQGWGENAWITENLFIEARPVQAVSAVRGWIEREFSPATNLEPHPCHRARINVPSDSTGKHIMEL